MAKKNTSPDQLIATIIAGIEDVKGKEITILDLREIENTVCEYFVICEGTSNTQVNAIVNSIQKKVSKAHKDTEGLVNSQNIKTAIPCGVYLNDPSSVEDDALLWRVGYLVEDSTTVKLPLQFATINRATYIVAKIKAHPFIAAFKTYPVLEQWILDNNYAITGSAVELYYEDVVESMFPVKDKALN